MRASDVSIRMNSCSFDISRLKNPTVMSVEVPTCWAMFRTKLVFPIEGRAATSTRSDGCSPDVISSRSRNPVGTPVTRPLCCCSFSIVAKLLCTRSRSGTKPARIRSSAIAKIDALRLVEQQVRLLLRLVRVGEDLVRRVNQTAQRRLLLDDPRVVLDVRRPWHSVGERRHVGRAADLVELARSRQLFLQGDEVDRVAALAQRDHAVEDPTVRVAEEIVRVDQLRRVIECFVADQNRAEDRLLCVEAVRKRTFGSGDVGHGDGLTGEL